MRVGATSGGLRRGSGALRFVRDDDRGSPAPGRNEVRREVTAAAEDEARDRARRLGLQSGLTVQEMGYDDDVDQALRAGIESVIGSELVDEDYDDVVDVVVMWWRDDDGDLADGLLDAIGPLTDHGVVWLMTPKPGRSGHIEAEDIADAAPTAGLQQTSTISAGSHWQGTRLVAPRAKR
ncbi:MAG: DUF3052 domain-containing protein [Actinobacteria bacterium]|nr:DUF3052 domain-containing protein [Actinomycetota bacterium]